MLIAPNSYSITEPIPITRTIKEERESLPLSLFVRRQTSPTWHTARTAKSRSQKKKIPNLLTTTKKREADAGATNDSRLTRITRDLDRPTVAHPKVKWSRSGYSFSTELTYGSATPKEMWLCTKPSDPAARIWRCGCWDNEVRRPICPITTVDVPFTWLLSITTSKCARLSCRYSFRVDQHFLKKCSTDSDRPRSWNQRHHEK